MVWKVGPDEDVARTAHNRRIIKALLISTHARAHEFGVSANHIKVYERRDIQSVTGGTDQTSGECSLGQTIPI